MSVTDGRVRRWPVAWKGAGVWMNCASKVPAPPVLCACAEGKVAEAEHTPAGVVQKPILEAGAPFSCFL